MKKGKEKDKQGREEGLASQHAAISDFILVEQPDTRGRSPWHTASTKAVCFWMTNKKVSERQRKKDRVVGLVVKKREMKNNKPNSVSKASEES